MAGPELPKLMHESRIHAGLSGISAPQIWMFKQHSRPLGFVFLTRMRSAFYLFLLTKNDKAPSAP